MNQKTALERLKISRKTLIKYRKALGIFKETKKNITDEQFEDIKRMRDRNKVLNSYTQQAFELKAEAQGGRDYIPILSTDSPQIQQLKKQYNRYTNFLEILGQVVLERAIKEKKIPSKDQTGLIEKYQGLQLKLAKELRHAQQDGDDIGALIAEKLKAYN